MRPLYAKSITCLGTSCENIRNVKVERWGVCDSDAQNFQTRAPGDSCRRLGRFPSSTPGLSVCVDHDILLNRLEKSFGFFGMAIGWIRSYLTGRKQYVRYSGSMSTVTPMLFGVPQGSVLGPLLFVLYTANVFHIAEELDFSIHGYADDLQIYDHCLVRDTVKLNGRLVHCIDCMGQWMLKNRLKLNASKTEFIWLGSPRRLAACSFDSIVVDESAI